MITTPPRNKIVYNPDNLLNPAFKSAIQAQIKIKQDLDAKIQEAKNLSDSIKELNKDKENAALSLREAEDNRSKLETTQLETLLKNIAERYKTLARSSEKLEKLIILNSKIVSVIT